jgi:hypothetical protein
MVLLRELLRALQQEVHLIEQVSRAGNQRVRLLTHALHCLRGGQLPFALWTHALKRYPPAQGGVNILGLLGDVGGRRYEVRAPDG